MEAHGLTVHHVEVRVDDRLEHACFITKRGGRCVYIGSTSVMIDQGVGFGFELKSDPIESLIGCSVPDLKVFESGLAPDVEIVDRNDEKHILWVKYPDDHIIYHVSDKFVPVSEMDTVDLPAPPEAVVIGQSDAGGERTCPTGPYLTRNELGLIVEADGSIACGGPNCIERQTREYLEEW